MSYRVYLTEKFIKFIKRVEDMYKHAIVTILIKIRRHFIYKHR